MDPARATRRRARREAALASLGLVLLVALVYGDYVFRGGLLWDDWENGATSHYSYEPGFLGPFDLRQMAYRPVLQLLLPLPHLVFGERAPLHLALALALAVAASTAFYALLRAAGGRREFALAAAALALVFPWSSSTRLWPTASLNLVAVVLVFAAATIALRAFRAGEPRSRALLTACMLAAGVLTYEAVAGLALLLPLLYIRHARSWREVLRRWRVEVAAVAAAALLVALATTKPERGGLAHVVAIGREGVGLAGRALAPWGFVPPLAALLVAAGAVAVRRSLARPVALSAAALVLAWAPFAPGAAKYVPGASGVYDRVNIVAGFALAALVCSLAALTRRRALQLALILAIGAGWVAQERADVNRYAAAASARDASLAAVARGVPDPEPGTVIVLLEPASWQAPGVPRFGRTWDLGAALKLRYGDASISGYPLAPSTPAVCGRRALTARTGLSGSPPPTPYARLVLVDARTGAVTRPSGPAGCRAALAALRGRRGSA